MHVTRSTMLRRTVAVAAAVATCVAGVFTVFALSVDQQPQAGDDTTVPRPTGPHPTVGVTGGTVPTTPETALSIDDLLARLGVANAVFKPPTSMRLDETRTFELLVSRRRQISELEAELAAELGEEDAIEGASIRASDAMQAQLSGVGFAIEPITNAVQVVAGEGVTRWTWEVKATEVGKQRLYLTLSAILDVNGKERTYTVESFRRTLEVDVTLGERLSGFLGDNWQWLWTALLVPLLAYLLQRRRHSRATGETPPETPSRASPR